MRATILILATTVLAGCAGDGRPTRDIGYLPPAAPPASMQSALVRQSPALVIGNVADRLQQEGMEVSELDEAEGALVVEYHGDPEPFVNCGWLVRYRTGEPLDEVRAATEETELVGTLKGVRSTFSRLLALDARMQVAVRPDVEGALVRTDATYTLTKTLRAKDPAGGWQQRHKEVIVFDTGQSATFTEGGTSCQPTGQFERLVLDSLPATTVVGARQ